MCRVGPSNLTRIVPAKPTLPTTCRASLFKSDSHWTHKSRTERIRGSEPIVHRS